jgi:hypothetical protein
MMRTALLGAVNRELTREERHIRLSPSRQDGVVTAISRPAMPNDLSIQAVAQPNPGSSAAAPSKPAVVAAPVEQTTPTAADVPNPTLALNAALGLVVIEFRNSTGAVVSSIPTAQQIQAYQAWQDSGIGRPPNLGASMTTAVPAVVSTQTVASAPDRAQAPQRAQAPTPAPVQSPAPAPTHTSAPATFGGSSHPTHLGIGV